MQSYWKRLRIPVLLLLIVLISFSSFKGNFSSLQTIQVPTRTSAATIHRYPANHGLQAANSSSSPIREIQLAQNDSEPLAITTDSLGNVWFAENNASAIVEYTPLNHTFARYPIPSNATSMIWFMLFDDNGILWFSNSQQPYLWSFSPITHQFANFSTEDPLAYPYGLAYDNTTQQIWFTSIYTDQIGYFQISGNDASLGRLINVTGPSLGPTTGPKFGPSGIAVDSQGNVFVSETFSRSIVEYSQSLQKFVNTWILPPGSQPVGIALDANRDRIWFSNHATSLIGYVNEKTGKVTEYATSLFSYLGENITLPYWIQLSSSGSIWFNEHVGNKIARFDPATGQLTEFLVPTNQSAPLRFAIDNLHNYVWFTELFGNKIGVLNKNQSCDCVVQLSKENLTLSSGSTDFLVMYTNSTGYGLFGTDSPPPLISGSLSVDGSLSANLTLKSSRINSSYYSITLERGAALHQGNYSITVCPNSSSAYNVTSSPPIRQCATALLFVTGANQGSENALIIILAVIVIAALLVVSLLFVRRWRF